MLPRSPDRSDPPGLVSLDAVRRAASTLEGVTVRTPLLPFGRPDGSDPLGWPRVWVKPESLQPIGAFKLRGAFHALASLSPEERARGVVAFSSGNHAQGVARAARLLGSRATIVMPADAPRVKLDGVRADGATLDLVGPSGEDRAARALEIAERDGLTVIPAYDDRRIIAGQGTIGLEIAESLDALDALEARHGRGPTPATVLVPIGGGGLASGVAAALRALRPTTTLLGVEPELAADARDSLRAGHIVRWSPDDTARTSADGMRTPALGPLTFAHLHALLDGVVTVTETEIERAMARAASAARLVLEPSGATALAAALFHADELHDAGRIVAILSGGNADPDAWERAVARGREAGG